MSAAKQYRPWASSPAARRVMQGNRKRDTRPELLLRSALHREGIRYRVACRPLPGRPWTADLVFRSLQVAVFVDGCYWHGCPDHYAQPRTNASYWGPKIEANRRRDAHVDAELSQAGWRVLRLWEHEPLATAMAAVVATVRVARDRPRIGDGRTEGGR